MASNDGRRVVVNDPLAPNPREQSPNRSLQLGGVHAPMIPSAASLTHDNGLEKALSGVEGLLAQEFEKKKDDWITDGKVAYQSGVTEQEMLATGNAFTAQGYRTLQARDHVNNWFTEQTVAMDETGKQTDPGVYASQLKQQRKDMLAGITDPHARKVASAAFEDMEPRLARAQQIKNNEYNRQQRISAYSSTLASTAPTSATASKQEPGQPLAMSPVAVEPVMQPSANDRDVAIRTMLGEAGNEGDVGMAAVAHVLRNRATDGRWPSSISGVALQPGQFSAWNDGAGGNSIPYSAKPGSPMYEKAGAVFDAVMSGKHVDPTGGATHYYSPAGMQKLVADGDQTNSIPIWLDEETQRGGGRIKIGGHIFVGKAANASVRPSVEPSNLAAADKELNLTPQEKALYERHVTNLNGPGGTDNPDGSRSTLYQAVQEHNGKFYSIPTVWNGKREVEKFTMANGTTMDVPNKTALANVAKEGWDKFPSYKTAEEADARYSKMHEFMDKDTASYMARKSGRPEPQVTATTIAAGTPGDVNAVAAQEHTGVTGVAQAKGPNEIQQLIYGYSGLNKEDKATAVADALRRTLDAGDDTLFRDAGGVAALHALGAKPGEIDEVLKAQKRFSDKKMSEFNVEREKYRSSILDRAEKGESIDSILADIDKSHKAGLIDDTNARALAHSAADKIRQQGNKGTELGNPDMLNELGGLYQKIATGGDFTTLAKEGTAIAHKYGASEKDVQHIVGKMFADSQAYQNKLRTAATTAAKEKAQQDGIKSEVQRAISQGYGLENVSGSIKTVNDHGQPVTVPAQEYAIQQIKDKWAKQYSDQVAAGKLTAEQAKPELERKVILELQNHNIVDKQMQAQFVGSLAGNIIDPKTGGVKAAATAAYDSWLTLKTTPGITPAYLSRVVGDDTTRNLLEHAFLLDSGELSKDQSLLKAHEILNDPNRDPEDKLKKDVVWRQKMNVDLKKALLERSAPSFLSALFQTADRSERERILTNDKTAENYVINRAEAYHWQNPNEHGEVSLEKAIQDLQAHSTPVMGNLIITKPGKELDKEMGVSGFGPNAAEDAISTYIRNNGEKIWGKSYTDREPYKVLNAIDNVSNFDRTFSPQGIAAAIAPGTFDDVENYKGSRAHHVPVKITFNAELGVMTVDLYKDSSMKQTLGEPKHFNVKSIGAQYVKEQTTPGSWAKTWNSMFKGTAKAVKDVLE